MLLEPETFNAFKQDLEKLGPADYKSNAWMKKLRALNVRYAKPEISLMLPIIRGEIARLDQLWEI